MANSSNVLKDRSNEFDPEAAKKDETLNPIAGKFGEIESNLKGEAKHLTDKAKKTATEAYENVGTMIQNNPVQSFLIGLGVGAIIGASVTMLVKR